METIIFRFHVNFLGGIPFFSLSFFLGIFWTPPFAPPVDNPIMERGTCRPGGQEAWPKNYLEVQDTGCKWLYVGL